MNILITEPIRRLKGDKKLKDMLKKEIRLIEKYNKIWYDRSMMLSKMLDEAELKVKKLKEKLKEKRK